MRTMAVLPVFVVLLAGCGSASTQSRTVTSTTVTSTIAVTSGRVIGTVLAGPTCPVEQIGNANCASLPVVGVVQLKKGDLLISSTRLDPGGAFTIAAAAGPYTLNVDTGASLYPRCQPVEVTVADATETRADIMCDTGLR